MADNKEDLVTTSFRVSRKALHLALVRAQSEGKSRNQAVAELIEGYGDGKIDTPKFIKVYASSVE